MLQFLTSLTFLFAFAITVMVWHGIVYYRSFARNGHLKRNFPWVFLSITVACFSFLYWNIHAPLRLQTFSNLDHHFIRHDGFLVDRRIELGKTDTINYPGNAFSRFTLTRENQQLNVSSAYSEEPFYISSGSSFRLLSAVYPASGHSIFFRCGATPVSLTTKNDRSFELHIGDTVFIKTGKSIHYGLSGWNIFRDDSTFINSPWYTNE